ncbi:PREDICTED: uncharacterized protein LOC108965785 isoform X1 [Bactrocera latifrons]|uniref:uncharacterized protein LOC108965785 isoform X1 n=1 Tax=Bactrocera latifrons TaxID=174628 RepID=UPI0008DE2D8C|nr:PREDICTED: uncharacterized protein LOC108965785 isoform X1 [Bactrocera latifrons]
MAGKHDPKVNNDTPAPGDYTPEAVKLGHSPAFSIVGRRNVQQISDTPAPGEYYSEKVRLDHTPAFTICGRKYLKHAENTPSPCDYKPEECKLDQSPAYTFGIKTNLHVRNESPAPGQYEFEKVNMDRGPAYTFGLKVTHEQVSETPAPTAYEPEKHTLDHAPSFSFGLKPKSKLTTEAPALPKGAYVEDRILQRRERRLASPVRTNQNQNLLNGEVVNSTDNSSNHVERTSNTITSTKIRTVGEQEVLENGYKTDKASRPQHSDASSTRTTVAQHIARGALSNGTDLKANAKAKGTTTTSTITYTVSDAGLDNGREIHTAQARSDARTAKSGGSITKTVVQSDGSAVTTTTTSKTSSVKYVVEANATHEKIISS